MTMQRVMPYPSDRLPSQTTSRKLSAEEMAALNEAEQDIEAGRFVSFAEAKAWVDSWDTPNELPAPFDRWR